LANLPVLLNVYVDSRSKDKMEDGRVECDVSKFSWSPTKNGIYTTRRTPQGKIVSLSVKCRQQVDEQGPPPNAFLAVDPGCIQDPQWRVCSARESNLEDMA